MAFLLLPTKVGRTVGLSSLYASLLLSRSSLILSCVRGDDGPGDQYRIGEEIWKYPWFARHAGVAISHAVQALWLLGRWRE